VDDRVIVSDTTAVSSLMTHSIVHAAELRSTPLRGVRQRSIADEKCRPDPRTSTPPAQACRICRACTNAVVRSVVPRAAASPAHAPAANASVTRTEWFSRWNARARTASPRRTS
jgi:hypothetical protein